MPLNGKYETVILMSGLDRFDNTVRTFCADLKSRAKVLDSLVMK